MGLRTERLLIELNLVRQASCSVFRDAADDFRRPSGEFFEVKISLMIQWQVVRAMIRFKYAENIIS